MAIFKIMKLSEELQWRGFVNQTTLTDMGELDKRQFNFYFGVDPSSDSMQVGNLAMVMMLRHFIRYGHKAVLLVGGATGLIGDPDGKASERSLLPKETIDANKRSIIGQYNHLFDNQKIRVVDNYDWFKDLNYLDLLRDIGKHVPLRQMLAREFVQSRLGEDGNGISYAEFSYVLIQAYDFWYLHQQYQVNLQLCGSDQWGNSIAGVDLIRRLSGAEAHVYSGTLIVNPQTGVKFGKTEAGAIWLDPNKTSALSFYQFWVNVDDAGVEYYLKIYTDYDKTQIDTIMEHHRQQPKVRHAQFALADAVTALVHSQQKADSAKNITRYLIGQSEIADADEATLKRIKDELAHIKAAPGTKITQALVESGLASSVSAAKQLLKSGAIYLNNVRATNETIDQADFTEGRLLLRRGKAYKDTALVEQAP